MDAGSVAADPEEIAEVVFVTGAELAALRAAEPFTAWFDDVWGLAQPYLTDWGFRTG
ncbi:hypothetical protein [Occultella kanbiaonis]|uniref:hypothetical protein n=1 Tax=Occultella kanbiaonis TaxID=2675754 RepID=UPI001E3FE405|nr:hypothetical protein [Occultella kanbiaonis]